MSDGQILKNMGNGWKLWKRLKPGIDALQYAEGFKARTQNQPTELKAYIKALQTACDLEHRWKLHTLIESMPSDPDGIWAHMDDYSYSLDLEDICAACKLYESAVQAVKTANERRITDRA